MADRVVVYRIEGRDGVTPIYQRLDTLDTKVRSGITTTTSRIRGMVAPVTRVRQGFDGVERQVRQSTRAVSNMRTRMISLGRIGKSVLSGLRGQLALMAGFFTVRAGFNMFAGMKTAASDLNEALNKSKTVFGDYSKGLEEFAQTSAKTVGQSKSQMLDSVSTIGLLFRGAGQAEKAAADLSLTMVRLGADIASAFNVDTGEAMQALRSGLTGEAEPLRRFGVFLTEAKVQQKALEMGLARTKKEITEGDKVLARHAIILKETSLIQGDFARTANDAANAERTLKKRMDDIKARLGQALIPAYGRLLAKLNQVADWIDANPEKFDKLIGGIITKIEEAGRAITKWLEGAVAWYKENRNEISKWIGRLQMVVTIYRAQQKFNLVILGGILDFVFRTIEALRKLQDALRPVVEFFAMLWRVNVNAIKLFIDNMRDLIDKIFPGFRDMVKNAFGFIVDKVFKPIADFIKRLFGITIDVPVTANIPKGVAGGGGRGRAKGLWRERDEKSGQETKPGITTPTMGGVKSGINTAGSVTGGAIKHITINIENLVRELIVKTETIGMSPAMIKAEMTRVLVSTVNDANLSQ